MIFAHFLNQGGVLISIMQFFHFKLGLYIAIQNLHILLVVTYHGEIITGNVVKEEEESRPTLAKINKNKLKNNNNLVL